MCLFVRVGYACFRHVVLDGWGFSHVVLDGRCFRHVVLEVRVSDMLSGGCFAQLGCGLI